MDELRELRERFVERLRHTEYEMMEAWLTHHLTHDVVRVLRAGDPSLTFACLDCSKQIKVETRFPSHEWSQADGSKLMVEVVPILADIDAWQLDQLKKGRGGDAADVN